MPSCYLLLASPVQKSSKPVFLKARTQPHSSPSIQAETKKPRSLCSENRTFFGRSQKEERVGVDVEDLRDGQKPRGWAAGTR